MNNAEFIEKPSDSKSEEPRIEYLNALIIYRIGFAKDTVCQNAGKSWIE
tara:strand:- start:39 stop:185 length:147 start_codon:yes stop_codon:yes gene_type:complete